MGGGAWSFLVGGMICLVNSDNERDHSLLNSNQNKYLKRSEVQVSFSILLWFFRNRVGEVLRGTFYLFSEI